MRARKLAAAFAAIPVLLTGAIGTAHADLIYNGLDTSIDAVAEIMPLTVGGSNGVTRLYVATANDDGKNGCNLTGSTTLTLSVGSSDTAVATVSPSTVTFGSCGETKTLTVMPVGQGSATVSVSQTGNTTGGTFNLTGATFDVVVAPATQQNSAPSVVVDGVAGGASYPKGAVPAAMCKVTDNEDGPSEFAASLSAVTGPFSADGIGQQDASCSYTDQGGRTASASVTYNVIDASAPTITYSLSPTAPDGDNDWYRSDVALDWTVVDDDSPSTLQTEGCDDRTIAMDGKLRFTCSAVGAGGSDSETVDVKRDATAPVVSQDTRVISGTLGQAGWYRSAVTVEFTAADATSGLETDTASVTSVGEGAAVEVKSPEFTDRAGNTSEEGVVTKTLKIDTQAPNAPTVLLDPLANEAGWHNQDVKVSFVPAEDNGASGVALCTAGKIVTAEEAGQEISGTCTDNAGNVSEPATVVINLDRTAPVVSKVVAIDGTEGANGWYTSDVDVTFSATDGLSGLSDAQQTVTVTDEGSTEVASPVFTDLAGNSSAAGDTRTTVKIDKTAPSKPTFTGLPESSFYFGSIVSKPTCTSEDAVSGATCAVTLDNAGDDLNAVGTHTFIATATNGAGLMSSNTFTYTVLAWTTKGFYAPVDMGGTWNTVKGGSTVPLKFEVFKGAQELSDTASVSSFSARPVACPGASAPADAIEFLTTGGTALRWDSTAGQFIQNWQTPKKPGTCHAVTVTMRDGSSLTANFILK